MMATKAGPFGAAVALLSIFALGAACSSKSGEPPLAPNPAADTGTGDAPLDVAIDAAADPLGDGPKATVVDLAPACAGPLAADGSALKFSDTSGAWELDATHLDVVGNHLEALDLDADGYPDLLVHMATEARSDPALAGNKQLVRVLMNRAKPGGGRRFVDATITSGYGNVRDGTPPAAGKLRDASFAVAADVDNDGDLDLFSAVYLDPTKPALDPKDRNEVLLNDGKGVFRLAKGSDVQRVPSDVLPPTTGATFVDADRDGIVDLYVGFWYRAYGASHIGVQARLFKGVGDGTFVDATVGSGTETRANGYDAGLNHRPAYGVTSCDLDDDGMPELMVSSYGRQWNLLYKNATTKGGALAFQEIGQASGFAGDDLRDYSDNEFYKCYCVTTGACTPASPPLLACSDPPSWDPSVDGKPWRLNGNTFTTVCSDLDGDGKLDLYNAEIAHWHIGSSSDKSELLVNEGATADAPIHFKRPGRAATGLDWPHDATDWNEGGIMVGSADLDLDGLDDLVVGASDYPGNFSMVYRQKHDAPGTFEEIGKSIGLHHQCPVGLAIADFDRDGDLDVVVGSSIARDCAKAWPHGNEVHLYENAINDGAQKRGFLQVALVGKGAGASNVTGIGARVKVVASGRVITKELGGGYGLSGIQHDTALTFGLGASCQPDELEVRWPDGNATRVRYRGVGGGRRVVITEGGGVTESPAK